MEWAEVIAEHARDSVTARRVTAQLRASEVAALAFCRLLEKWAKGDASPATPGGRTAALRHAADRAETALCGLEDPLARYLEELGADHAEGVSWYGGPGAGELVEWKPVLDRAGVPAPPERVASAYLELALFVRALEGLSDQVRLRTRPDSASLWAGLFDLRDTLFHSTLDDLRALAA